MTDKARVSKDPVAIVRGDGPIVLAIPHAGDHAPADIFENLNPEGQALRDADWRVDRLYQGLAPNATVVAATFHRYVIDANRDPSGASLYPGQNTTGLVPLTNFDGRAIWKDDAAPGDHDIEDRLARFHRPYHDALRAEIERVRKRFGVAILYDCHSIRSRIPHLFEGVLPDLNIGTNDSRSCDAAVEILAREPAERSGYSFVVNGRFKGGWTTRHYGDPAHGVHAIQMELTQANYLATETPPFEYDDRKADRLRSVLDEVLRGLEALARTMAERSNGGLRT